MVNKLRGVPWKPTHDSDDINVPVVIAAEPEVEDEFPEVQRPARQQQQDKRLYIETADLNKYGYTKGCNGCEA